MVIGIYIPITIFIEDIFMYKRIGLFCILLFLLFIISLEARIIFSSLRDGIYGIYTIRDNGSGEKLLLSEDSPRFPFLDSISPNGKLLALLSKKGFSIMDSDGTNLRVLPVTKAIVNRMSFSPDSGSLLFSLFRNVIGKDRTSIVILDIETGNLEEISKENAFFCDWSPDGKRIVYSKPGIAGEEKGPTIWLMDIDGSDINKLLEGPLVGAYVNPRWSLDGRQVLFAHRKYTWRAGDKAINFIPLGWDILVYNIFDKNLRKLFIPEDYYIVSFTWLDDNVIFSAYTDYPFDRPQIPFEEAGSANIYRYDLLSNWIIQLTHHEGVDGALNWIDDDILDVSLDGKKK